jgi:hypothetical protein
MKTTVKRIIRDEKGTVMILALILLVVGGLILAPMLGLMTTGLIAGQVYERKTDELYAADAGVENAIWMIQSGAVEPPVSCGDPEQWFYSIAVNGRTVAGSIEYVGDQTYRVISIATGAGDSATTVESYVFYGSPWHDILDYGIVALNGDITISGTSELDSYPEPDKANIYAHGDINIDNNSKVWGNATATGTIIIKDRVTGTATEGCEPIEFILPNLDVYLAEANKGELIEGTLQVTTSRTLGPARITGDLDLTSQAVLTLGGPVWVEGKVKTAGGSEIMGQGPLVAVGSVYLGGGAASATEEMPVVISAEGPIDAAGTEESFMVLYAPEGMITIQGGAKTNGAAIGKEVKISISAKCKAVYDSDVIEVVRAPSIEVLTWEVEPQ